MSVKIMGWVWDQDIRPPAKKMVLLAVADHADHDGDNAWPSVARLGRMVGIEPRSVQRHLRELEAEGYLIVHNQAGGTVRMPSDKRPNLYTVVIRGDTSVAPQDDRGDTSVAPRGDTHVTLSILGEPSNTCSAVNGASEIAKAPRANDLLFDALVMVCKINPKALTSSARGAANRAIKELRQVGAEPEQIIQAASAYRLRYPDSAVTPSALAKHWPSLLEAPAPAQPVGPTCAECRGTGYVTEDNDERMVSPCWSCC